MKCFEMTSTDINCYHSISNIGSYFGGVMSTCQVNIRLENTLKEQAEALFSRLGISMPEAIRMFLRQSVAKQALPLQTSISEVEKLPELGLTDADCRLIAQAIESPDQFQNALSKLQQFHEKFVKENNVEVR